MRALLLGWCLVPLWLMSCSKAPIPPPARIEMTARTPPATIPWAPPSALKEAWRFDLGESRAYPAGLIGDDIVLESRDAVFLVDARTGTRGPTLIALDGSVKRASPGIEPARLFVHAAEDGSAKNEFSGFDIATGNLIWKHTPENDSKWCASWAAAHRGLPSGVAADMSRSFDSGRPSYAQEHSTTVIISQCPTLREELEEKLPIRVRRLLPSSGWRLNFTATSLDPLTGKVRWTRSLGGGEFRPPYVHGDFGREWFDLVDDRFLYVLGPRDPHELSVYDLEDGQLRWRRKFKPKTRDIDIFPAGNLVWVRESDARPRPYDAASGEPASVTGAELDARYKAAFPLSKPDPSKASRISPVAVDFPDATPEFQVMTRDALFTVVNRLRVEVLDPLNLERLAVLAHKQDDPRPGPDSFGNPFVESQVHVYPGALASGEPIVLTVKRGTLYGWRRSLP